ncbi:MAG: four helix bundle protein [Clostridia bacterium]|nr:four helix bundle protein [Clostridia bacterium]
MADNQLVILSKAFAVDIIGLCESLRERRKATAILNQLLRSGTSIGANIHEANYASSKADFINKFQIALKECYETDYWLEIFHDSKVLSDEEYSNMFSQCSKLRKLLIASITTAKKNAE